MLANSVSKRQIAEGKRRIQRCIRVRAFDMGFLRREHEVGQALGFKAEHSEFDAILNQARCPHRELVSIRHESHQHDVLLRELTSRFAVQLTGKTEPPNIVSAQYPRATHYGGGGANSRQVSSHRLDQKVRVVLARWIVFPPA